jgi:hypothetical protein
MGKNEKGQFLRVVAIKIVDEKSYVLCNTAPRDTRLKKILWFVAVLKKMALTAVFDLGLDLDWECSVLAQSTVAQI